MDELANPTGPRKELINNHCLEFMQMIKVRLFLSTHFISALYTGVPYWSLKFMVQCLRNLGAAFCFRWSSSNCFNNYEILVEFGFECQPWGLTSVRIWTMSDQLTSERHSKEVRIQEEKCFFIYMNSAGNFISNLRAWSKGK